LKNGKLRKAILSAFYNISQRNFGILLILWCSFKLWWNFVQTCLDQNFTHKGKGLLKSWVLSFESGCVRTACSQLLWQVWNKSLSPCYKVDDGNRLATSCSNKTNIQAVRNKLLRACSHQLVNNLLRADDIRLVGTTCSESVGLVNLARW
jgi:hypothetical protein